MRERSEFLMFRLQTVKDILIAIHSEHACLKGKKTLHRHDADAAGGTRDHHGSSRKLLFLPSFHATANHAQARGFNYAFRRVLRSILVSNIHKRLG